ncbi:MAG: hypothetical protein JRI68_25585 [Deltaproteobacteria bacterium]|nr:hypothetical protein [Deltaproteobacteria bacterium]
MAAVVAVCATSSSSCAPQPSPSEPITGTAAPRGAPGAARAQGESPAAPTDRPAPGSPQPSTAIAGTGADRDAAAGPASSAGSGFRFGPGCPGAERNELAKRKVEQIAKGLTCASLSISRFPDADALDVRSDSWEIYPETPWGERAPVAEYCRFDRQVLRRVEKAVWAGLDETDRACMLGYSVRVVGGDREQIRQLNDRVRSRCQSAAMLTWLVVDFDAGGTARAVRPRSGVHVDANSPERRCLQQALRGEAYPCLANSTLCQANVVE